MSDHNMNFTGEDCNIWMMQATFLYNSAYFRSFYP